MSEMLTPQLMLIKVIGAQIYIYICIYIILHRNIYTDNIPNFQEHAHSILMMAISSVQYETCYFGHTFSNDACR